jgi:hypothetical protein
MMAGFLISRESFEVPCTVEVEHSFDSLHAYAELDGDIEIYPGDEVIIHDAPVDVPFGETRTMRSTATVIRASALERAWTKLTGRLEFMELLEFSFSSGKKL